MTATDLESLRFVERADVHKAGEHAATLTRVAEGVEFRYRTAWLEAGGQPVATSLPVTPDPVVTPGGALPSYFAGLLPEGRRLGVLRRETKTSADDELTLLLAVGADAIGDVQAVPDGAAPTEVPPRIAIDDIGRASFAELLDELGVRAQRAALPGVQDKTSAAMINLPIARAGERHILKLNPVGELPHLVENEAFFLDAARRSGLTVPAHELVTDRDGAPGLLVRRFDRVTVEGKVRALAVEDGCQAADRPPADKYRLGADRVFAALTAVCDAPAVAGRDLLRQLAFAFLTGNGDAHAKNFTVLQDLSGEWRASPAYDLPCSQVYGDHTMALAVDGRTDARLGGEDFVALGTRLGVPERATRRMLDELTERADRWLGELDRLPFDAGRVRKLRRVIDHRRGQLRR
ncbi:type II toxin-antitoxin system HipA family toxin [Nocardioides humi]|uniref:Type II toxin-antitoxin system HipA family toxin n=1 Tax=Nocardioides humi TaxID=449461 RepID=A0ABN2BCJ1_9ACTN|nr:HipA domain-containing protein [Nocardioides humi]